MLYLNEQDIREAVTMQDMVDAIDESYHIYHKKDYTMPTRMQLKDENNTLVVMPCIGDGAFGTKLITTFPDNTEEPTIHGLFILKCETTGKIQAIMDGSFLTGMRTGAIGGSAIRHLAKEDASSIAIIGTGVQGFYQAEAACSQRPIKDIYLYNRTSEKMNSFRESLAPYLESDVTIHLCDSAAEAIQDAQIIITATTSDQPVLPNEAALLQGKLIIGIGSFQPTMREFPQSAYSLATHVLVDSDDAIKESGDLTQPLENKWLEEKNIKTMADFLATDNSTPTSDETTLFKSTGIALFDIVSANKIFQQAVQKETGQVLNNSEPAYQRNV